MQYLYTLHGVQALGMPQLFFHAIFVLTSGAFSIPGLLLLIHLIYDHLRPKNHNEPNTRINRRADKYQTQMDVCDAHVNLFSEMWVFRSILNLAQRHLAFKQVDTRYGHHFALKSTGRAPSHDAILLCSLHWLIIQCHLVPTLTLAIPSQQS